jgi:hypothetical protein
MLLTSYYKSSTNKVPPIPTPRDKTYRVSTAGQTVRTAWVLSPHTHPIKVVSVNRRRTDNTMARGKKNKRTNNDLQNYAHKTFGGRGCGGSKIQTRCVNLTRLSERPTF